ncbi:DNA recombination protein RmuC [Pseudoalteromonas sp. C2R02]|nr:DNA recombination protein RmuC [Pseudoalteromonas sp. C2R02]
MVSNDLYEHKSRIAQHQEKVKSYTDKINLLEKSEIRLTQQFENIANKIFSEKTASFTQQNKTGLDGLLTPLKEQLSSFSKQVNDVYTTEAKERHALKSEILGLKELNVQMGLEANALTKALKGDNKKQGTWGEVVLERVLQSSGLREGHEYETQLHLKNQDGKAYKPDVVIHLPQSKDVVVDSKMVLVAYERFHNAQTEGEQSAALKSHIDAIKNHVKELSAKDYQMLHGITSLDYVLMFIPVEPAFNAALEYEPTLVQFALEKNIMLVSPNNLIVALRTINNMWRMEYQNRNAQDIADKAGSIYDKLVGFVDDMKKVGINLERAESSYDDAMKKLSEGRGNLVKKAEEMKSLNIKVKKSLPKEMIEKSEISIADPTEITSKLQ